MRKNLAVAAYAAGYMSAITSRPGDAWAKCPHRKGTLQAEAWHKGAWKAREVAHAARMERRKRTPV